MSVHSLDEDGFVLKSHVQTMTGRLVIVDIRYAREGEAAARNGHHHIQEGDNAVFDEIMTKTVSELRGLQFMSDLLTKT
jgi:hypothetical protein